MTDLISFLACLLITLTGFRTLYLITILSVNGHLSSFNTFLKNKTKSNLLLIKLLQIEKLLSEKDPVKRTNQLKNYLSFKYCLWLTFIEWLLDLAVLPFILGYILIHWRYRELFKLAVD